ncbi:MAG: dienelactone hydrolase [Pirellulales bacterium]|nr:dienelactone hydrolase [Pirellulales bacterium]
MGLFNIRRRLTINTCLPHQLKQLEKYSVFTLVICSSLFCVPCLAYDPAGGLFDLEESHAIYIESSNEGRVIPLLISLPEKKGLLPVILFSHGLGGSRNGYKYVRAHWTGRGYATIFLQHPGSDDSLLKGVSPSQALRQLRGAATRANMNLRADDVTDVLDAMSVWTNHKESPFYGRMDENNVGMAGHSMGAVTSQLMIGQQRWLSSTKKEKRIQAAVLMSPSSPSLQSAGSAFGAVTTPCLLLTGTRDSVPMLSNQTVESRRAVFEALPSGNAYELVFDKARHSAFSDRPRQNEPPHNPKHHTAIQVITTAFWDAYLQNNKQAKKWLKEEAAKILDPNDVWQTK